MKRLFWSLLFVFTGLLTSGCTKNFNLEDATAGRIYPGESWEQYVTPEEAGFSSEKLTAARLYSDQIGSAAVMVIYKGAVVAQWGEIEKRFMCHSVRKSFLSALYGVEVAQGNIRLDANMADLGVDDVPPLTDIEKQATVRDLLMARSGVYHAAAYETPAMKAACPPRSSHAPGTFYYYNNWDFNTLGGIFDQATDSTIFQKFKTNIADPLHMQDFRLQDGYYHLEAQHSKYPAYPFRMSARDMARFGLLFLRQGKWRDRQVIPQDWIAESTTQYSEVNRTNGYAYLWWNIVAEPFKDLGTYTASGYGGHLITVVPEADLVFVHRVNTWWDLAFANYAKTTGPSVGTTARLKLLEMILDAHVAEPKPNPQLVMLDDAPIRSDIIKLNSISLENFTGDYEFIGNYIAHISVLDGNLLIDSPGAGAFTLLPTGETDFITEDIEAPVSFKLDDNGKPLYLTIEFAPEEIYYGVAVDSGASGRSVLDSLTYKLDILTPELMQDLKVPGVSISVIADGQIAWSKGYGVKNADRPEPVTPATVFEACSMSKVVFTYVVLKLVEQGKLDLDRPLVEYLDVPYLDDQPLHKLITARMVLTHRTGFPNWRAGGWRSSNPLPVNFTPGTQYGYSGEGFLYLQRVVEHITGLPLNDMMQQMLLQPIGMSASSYAWEPRYEQLASAGHDEQGNVKTNRSLYDQANAAFSLYTTPNDYARFIVEVLKQDRSAPYSLNQKSIAEMLTPTIEIDGSHGVQIPRVLQSQCKTVHRGLGWVVGKTKNGATRAWHSGSNGTGFRCQSEFDPQTGCGIVIMTGSVNGVTLYRRLLAAVDFP